MLKNIFIIVLLTVNSLLVSGSNQEKIAIRPKPDWVIENKPETGQDSLSQDCGGYFYLLLDIQENIAKETTYCHYSIKLLNNDGVQNMSDISVDFDPDYQKLIIHKINRIRNNIITNEISRHRIKTIQREPEMERYLYDGRLTAYVNLEDVREGDIIDYSYSIEGYNPIYKKNYFKSLKFEYSDPIGEIYRSIIAPLSMKLYINYPYGKQDPVIVENRNEIVYTWNRKHVKSHIYDNNVPSWYNDNERVNISTFKNWNEVADLIRENYVVSETEMASLENLARDIFVRTNKDSLLIDVIRFVQDNIRYLGFESGLNGYKPIMPDQVMVSRYGDCKSKSLLLCSLLKLYGITAHPVLVNSNQIKDENQVFFSPEEFNHCIVQVYYKNKVFYIDPTISNQGGGIDNYYVPDYGYCLVLKEGTDNLVSMINKAPSMTLIHNYIKIPEIRGTVDYKVITEYSGYFADDIRSSFKNRSTEETSKDYLKFYSKSYPYISLAGPLKYKDDREKNLFIVEENYKIDSAWIRSEDNARTFKFNLSALIISSLVSLPASPERKMPYYISFPIDHTEEFIIDLPIDWKITINNVEIKDSVFFFSYNSSYKNKHINLQYKYKTFRNYQNSCSFKDFYSKHQKISDNLSYNLLYTPENKSAFKFSWIILWLFAVILTIGIICSVWIYRNYNLETYSTERMEIGGWLILIAIGLGVSTIRVITQLFFTNNFFNQNTWLVYINPQNLNIPLFLLLGFEFIYNVLLFVYLILIQILFYKKRNILPRLIIVFYSATVIFSLFDTLLAHTLSPDSFTPEQMNKAYLEIANYILVGIIWITYFLRSKRVKSTFNQVIAVREKIPPDHY